MFCKDKSFFFLDSHYNLLTLFLIKIFQVIEINKEYINWWNNFSKTTFVSEFLKENQGPVLWLFSDEKNLQQTEKLSSYFKLPFFKIESYSQIVEYFYNGIWKYVATPEIFKKQYPESEYEIHNHIIELKIWTSYKIEEISEKLNVFGYKYSPHQTKASFQVQWDTLTFISYDETYEYKCTFWWDTLEEILIIDKQTGIIDKKEIIYIWKNKWLHEFNEWSWEISDFFKEISFHTTILDNLDFYQYKSLVLNNSENYIHFKNFSDISNPQEKNLWIQDLFLENIDDFKNKIEASINKKISIYTKNKKTIENFLDYNNWENIEIIEIKLNFLKSYESINQVVICDDNLSRIFVKKRVKRKMSKKLDLLLQIKPWDYIVHVDHWIWVFQQILEKELPESGWNIIKKEYIELSYKENDKLFVPITEVGRINKYVWVENPKLTALSTKQWEKQLKKVNANVEQIAHELLELYAQRALQKGFASAKLPEEEKKFYQSFEYSYTEDQINIIQEIYTDMESVQPMDRLVSGDVWFGKTEIAFAALYKALINGRQWVLISPLVVLAYEHYEKACQRFSWFPFNIAVVTRFETKKNVEITLDKLKKWQIDLVIWTHRLLSEDVQYKNLWVLVIDEEHKFWVKDKDRIKELKGNIDILALSATPIPRSLNMALNGIKSVSMLTTPPVWRQAIQTLVSPFEENIIKEAWDREFSRNGQLFFIHNKVSTIETFRDRIAKFFPKKKIIIAHWQLPGDQLEKRILAFRKKEYDILLATTVIENWIDFPNVNTIFINDAYNFWISQIHQLRWRVWRSDRQWYCYLLFQKDKIKDDAAKRLKTIVDYSHLWAWFELAVKDLEIRWGWDILGIKQSGQSTEVWVNLYLEMLENKIEQLKRTGLEESASNEDSSEELAVEKKDVQIDLQISAYIDDKFFHSELDKINFYREIESLDEMEDLENIIQDFHEINEDLTPETKNFFSLLKVKILSQKYSISHIKKAWINYQIDFHENTPIDLLKKFLLLDTEVKLIVTNGFRLRSPITSFNWIEDFVEYLQNILQKKSPVKKKIKLKRK